MRPLRCLGKPASRLELPSCRSRPLSRAGTAESLTASPLGSGLPAPTERDVCAAAGRRAPKRIFIAKGDAVLPTLLSPRIAGLAVVPAFAAQTGVISVNKNTPKRRTIRPASKPSNTKRSAPKRVRQQRTRQCVGSKQTRSNCLRAAKAQGRNYRRSHEGDGVATTLGARRTCSVSTACWEGSRSRTGIERPTKPTCSTCRQRRGLDFGANEAAPVAVETALPLETPVITEGSRG